MKQTAEPPVVLIAEANVLIGLDLSEVLTRSGYRVLGPFMAASEALTAIERDSPSLAVIDIALQDGVCTSLIETLDRRRIPFLIHSAHRHDEPHFVDVPGGVPWLVKPASMQEIVALCGQLTAFGHVPDCVEPVLRFPSAVPAWVPANPFVRKLEGFARLTDADRGALTRISAHPHTVAAGTDLIREGDKPDGVLLIMDGMAYRHKMRIDGARQIMAYLVPGDAGDLDGVLLDEMDHTITTFSDCQVVRIPSDTVAALLEHHPQIARALRKSTLVDEATLREWLMNVGCRLAAERIAHLFCELLVRLQAVGRAKDNSYALSITQDDIADTTGMSVVHVNRTLKELRGLGLIELRRRRLIILDLPRLKELAEFKANYLHVGDRAAA